MRELRDVLADAYELRELLEAKRRRMEHMCEAAEAHGDVFAATIIRGEVDEFDGIRELVYDMVRYLETLEP
jgi:hypothetical protein